MKKTIIVQLGIAIAALLTSGCHSASPPAQLVPASDLIEVGYGRLSQRNVASAVSSLVIGREMRQVRHVEEMLERIPGITLNRMANGRISVRIRGANSLLGSNEPLFVIDGTPITHRNGDALIGVSPHDVVRVEVLKDAGAAAVYGSRGANGVILVTTRRGT